VPRMLMAIRRGSSMGGMDIAAPPKHPSKPLDFQGFQQA
jgi:hypothetical protein